MANNYSLANEAYTFIWDHLLEHNTLPNMKTVSVHLGISYHKMQRLTDILRTQGRIAETTLFPLAYTAWWRKQAQTADSLFSSEAG